MRVLYHFELCPFSRKVRIYLQEKNLEHRLSSQKYWERPDELMYLHPSCEVPILALSDKEIIWDSSVIIEYLEEIFNNNPLLGESPEEKARNRQIINWFDKKFYNEVSKYLVNEKIIKYFTNDGHPSSEFIRAAKTNLDYHMKYIEYLLQNQRFISGNKFTLSDISVASHLSVVDYLGDINWQNYNIAKEWYALIKSRPSFRNILKDRIVVFSPPKYYDNPDF